MALSSDELNYLIYRYLQESGFSHSAFAFACESLVAKASVSGGDIPPGALISFVQKGLQYLEIEASVQGVASADPSGAPALSLLHWHASKVAENAEENTTFDEFSVPEPMVATLAGHTGDVYLGCWNPKRNEILTGSEDGTTRLWKLSDDACSAEVGARCVASEQNHDGGAGKTSVTSITWNAEGTAFATGSFDGFVRFWTAAGQLSKALQIHKGPVFSIRFNASGSLLLSCGQDKCAIVTEVASGSQKQKMEFHSGAVIDCDWRFVIQCP
jgi:transducin (beta)-like 1